MNKLSRYNYIDVLRVFSSFAVIATHVIMYYIYTFKVGELPWTVLMSCKVLTQFAVPVFFMVSGATIFSSSREESYGSFIKRRLLKIAIPLFSYSVIYYLFFVYIPHTKHDFVAYEFGFYQFFKRFAHNNIEGHFWYLYALIPLYFVYPAVKKWVQSLSKKGLLTVIISIFVIDSVIPLLNQMFALFCDFEINDFSFGKLGVYLNYTLIGYYIHTYVPANKKNGIISALAGILSVGAIILLTLYTSQKKFDQQWMDILLAFVFVQSACVMILTKCLYEKKQLKPLSQKLLSTMGVLSFSAYLVHMLILRIIQIYLPRPVLKAQFSTGESAYVILIVFIAGVIISYLWSFIVSKIPVIKKIL